ncbi:MAG TPA: carboxypeptidase-like regulatory domain-containing protein, partial [Bryobacteraceae bacterium]|nr:carboxypeptidase-like regulatory domain-containing protein [Bryobacteraceae bacterium]
SIRGMKEDEYDSSFERDGFAPPAFTSALFRKLLHVGGPNPARLDVELTPYGKIRGRVVDVEGKPVANVTVSIDGPRMGRPLAASTGADGDWAFDKLLPGSWTILAKPKPAMREDKDGARAGYVFTYFPAAAERKQAAPVIVRAGAEVSGLEIRLRSVALYRVRGVVLNEDGRPAPDVTVTIHSKEPATEGAGTTMMGAARAWYPGVGMGPEIASTQTDAEGRFEFSSVGEGDWLVRAEASWGFIEETKRDVQAVGSLNLSVSQKDVGDVKIRLATNFDLPLSVDFGSDSEAAAGAAPRGALMVVLSPVDGGPEVFGMPGKDGKPVLDRAYPGRYRVMAQTMRPDFYIASMDYAGREITGPIEITPGPQPLHLVLRKHAGVLRGTIEKGAAATVILVPAAGAENEIVRGVTCAAGTLFQFDNLRPGPYAIVAFDRIEDGRLSDPAYVSRLLNSAKTIAVEEGNNPSIELSVNRWPD